MKIVLYFIVLFLTACTKKEPQQRSPILALKEMGDLATVEYMVTKIIKANDNQTWFKLGDRKILMSCEAHIKAGVDLSSINENNFTVNGKTIKLQLPPPKIISFSMPPEKIKVEYQQVTLLRDPFNVTERDNLAVQAETQIRNSINNLGILEQAKANTSLLINNMLRRSGFENITITYSDAPPVKSME